jgi:hypothetical protein
MHENQKKTLTIAATLTGCIVWLMGKAMTSGVRTIKGTGGKLHKPALKPNMKFEKTVLQLNK